MAKEHAPMGNKSIIFLKLDFLKAYDRVSHDFIWEVLRSMGFSKKMMSLIRGLVTGAQSKEIREIYGALRSLQGGATGLPSL